MQYTKMYMLEMKKMLKLFQFINKGKCKIYKIIEFLLIFTISFYFEELHSDTA